MESNSNLATSSLRTTHPLVLLAAASVTALSFAGIGVMAGWLPGPSSHSMPTTPVAPVTSAQPTSVTVQQTFNLPQEKASATPAKPVTRATTPRASRSVETATAKPTSSQTAQAPAQNVCVDCGRVESIREIAVEGKASGAGAVVGGVLGGLAGNQVGAGSGKDLATLAGIFGGAIAGHHVEKNMHEGKRYDITVRLDDGRSQIVSSETPPIWRVGDRVKLRNGELSSDVGPDAKPASLTTATLGTID